jgi:DNA-binding transcriptional LysR family regulator
MPFSLRTLSYIVATADAKSVSKAAETLSVSQPAISGVLAEAEARLGTQLFVRHHARGVTPTVAGLQFVHEARLLLKHAKDFEKSIATLGSSITGEITVGCFVTLATRYMPGLLAEFSRRLPGITVRLEEGHQQDIIDGLLSGRFEIALSYAYALPREIAGARLTELPPYLLVSSEHPLAKRKSISLREIAGEPFILLDLPHSRDYFMNLFMACGALPLVVYRAQSYELIRGLVGHGHGYTIHNALPGTSVTYDGGRVTARPIAERVPPVQVMSLHRRGQTMRPAVKAFADFLSEAFSPAGMFHAPTEAGGEPRRSARAGRRVEVADQPVPDRRHLQQPVPERLVAPAVKVRK